MTIKPCPNAWHDAPLAARGSATCIDCGAKLVPTVNGQPFDQASTVPCPECHARPGERCTTPNGEAAPGVLCHSQRVLVWRSNYRLPHQVFDRLDEHDRRLDALLEAGIATSDLLNAIIEILRPGGYETGAQS